METILAVLKAIGLPLLGMIVCAAVFGALLLFVECLFRWPAQTLLSLLLLMFLSAASARGTTDDD